MKIHCFTRSIIALALVAWLSTLQSQMLADLAGSAFTYQGKLSSGGNAVSGSYDLKLTIYDAATNGSVVAGPLTNLAVTVNNGLFITALDFGTSVFNGDARWVGIEVRTNGSGAFTPLSPRQPLTPTPYALSAGSATDPNLARLSVTNTATAATGVPTIFNGFVVGATVTYGGSGYQTPPGVSVNGATGSGAVVTANIAGGSVVGFNVVSAGGGYPANATLTVGPPPPNAYQTFPGTNYFSGLNTFSNASGSFSGNGAGLTDLNASQLAGTVPDARLGANVARTNQVWLVNGNAGTSPANGNFLGTTDFQPLELKVNGQRAFRLEPANPSWCTNGVNLVAGSPLNYMASGVFGSVIAGGGGSYGYDNTTNSVYADFCFIGSGAGNSIQPMSWYSFLGSGFQNCIQTNSYASFIGSGARNCIQTNAYESFIGGGYNNLIEINAHDTFLGGGANNSIQNQAQGSFLGSGYNNWIGTNAAGSFLGSGERNLIGSNATHSFLGGGFNNSIQINAGYSFLGSGENNDIEAYADHSVLGGGKDNSIQPIVSYSVLVGGEDNYILNHAHHSVLGGGAANLIGGSAAGSFLGGGERNLIGGNAHHSVLGGGGGVWGNSISLDADHCFLGGGDTNLIQMNASYSFLGCGFDNWIGTNASFSFLGGGTENWIEADASYSFLGGGLHNSIQINAGCSFLGGGSANCIQTNASSSFLGGGYANSIQSNAWCSFLGGGWFNYIRPNADHSFIGGGGNNIIGAQYSVIPGGDQNVAGGTNSFAAGHRAKANHTGAFVWADSTDADFISTADNEVSFRCNGGVRFTSSNGGAYQTASWTPGSGSWSFPSDRNLKEDFAPVDGKTVLEKVTRLPVSEWRFKGCPQRHIGPMAQDFHAAFPLNDSETTLNDADLHGVALAAIQGLNQKVEEDIGSLRAELKRREAENAVLKSELAALKNLVNTLSQKLNPTAR